MTDKLDKEIEQITSHRLPERHTFFQLQYFLIGKEPTVQAKMWRCVRELKARKDTLEAIKLEIEAANDDLLLINMKIEQLDAGVSDESLEKQIKKRKLERKKVATNSRLKDLNNRLESVGEESEFLVKAFRTLESIEPLKPHDDLNSQKAYWNDKLTQELNLRSLFGLPLDLELMKTILALNSDAPIKQETLKQIEKKHSLEHEKRQAELDRVLENTKKHESRTPEMVQIGNFDGI